MKKVLPALVLASFLVLPLMVAAQEPAPTVFTTPGQLQTLINTIGNWVFTFLLVIAGLFLIVAGFFFVTAQGNPEQVNKARQMLVNALIGVAIAVMAKGLVAVIQNVLTAAPAVP